MKRLLILDPGLTTVLSHNYSEANALVREARALDLDFEVFCHLEAHQAVVQIPARPHFHQLSYGHMADSRPAADFMAINFCTQATGKDLDRLTAATTADDLVLFPTVTCNIVLAIAEWMQCFEPSRAPRFGLCLMFPPNTNTSGRPSPVALNTYRQAFARIPEHLADRIVYTCEIDSVSDMYEPLLGVRPITLPIPTRGATEPPRKAPPSEMRIAFLGGARAEKGFHLLPDVIAQVREQRPDIRFTVQAVGYELDFVQEVTRRLEAHSDVVTLLRKPLSDDELMAAMRETSLLLLPYDPDRYRSRGSSLFTEARRLGVPVVLPAGTSIGDEGRRLEIGETFEQFTAEGVANAVMQALARWEQLSRSAIRVAGEGNEQPRDYLAVLLRRLGLGA